MSETPLEQATMEDRYLLKASLQIDNINTLKVFANPLRLRILRTLYNHGEGCPLSPKQIQIQLGEEGNKRLYYHVNLLESVGLIRKVAERKIHNLVEAFYVPVAKRLHIAPELFLSDTDDTDALASPLVSMVIAYLGAVEADLPMIGQSNPNDVVLAHREFTLSEIQAKKMRVEIMEVIDTYEAFPPTPDASAHRLTVIAYPKVE